MNEKHYVSLEVAKMLKEKGYNEECYLYYKEEDPALYYRELYNRNSERDDIISAPSLLEAMDWIEERGIILFFGFNTMCQAWWFSGYHKSKKVYLNDLKGVYNLYKDRNECMNAAIKKGVELL
jgi:hypothetical protein